MGYTIEFGLGQNASTNRKSIFPIADIKGRDGRMVGHLAEDTEREMFEQQSEEEKVSDTLWNLFILHLLHCTGVCPLCICQTVQDISHEA